MTILNTTTTDSVARLEKIQGDPQHAGFQVIRRWERVNATYADGLAVALDTTVVYTNPKADKQQYSGTFIQSRLDPVAREDDSIDLVQTLTKVKSVTDSSDADVFTQEGDPAVAGFKMVRGWHYINPYSLDTLFNALNGIEAYDSGVKGNTDNYSGKFIVSRVRSAEQPDRTYDLIQELTKVTSVDSLGDLVNPLIDREKEIIHPFGEGTGVGRGIVYRYINLDPASDTKCMVFTDTQLVGQMTQNDSFIHVARKTTTEDDRTMTFWVLAQRKQRIAWGDTVYLNPDHIEDENNGRDGVIRSKSWFGIDNDCYEAVNARLNDTSDIDTNYSLLNVRVRDNDDGSDDWVQTIIKRLNDTRTDSEIVATHSLEHTALQSKHFDFNNYRVVPPASTIGVGWKFVARTIGMNPNGLFRVNEVHEKPDPSNAVSSGVPENSELMRVVSPMVKQLDHTGKAEKYVYEHIPIASADSVMRTLDSTADTRYIVEGIDYDDMGRGNARVNRNIKYINYNGSWYFAEVGDDNNGATKSRLREWPYVTDTYADVLMDSSGDAVNAFSVGSDSFVHLRAIRTRHYDGTSTVRQYAAEASVTASPPGSGVSINIGSTTDSELSYNYFTLGGEEHKIITYQKIFSVWATAIAFADRSSTIFMDGTAGEQRHGSVKLIGSGKWMAYKVQYIA